MARRPSIEYVQEFEFSRTPQALWDLIEQVDQFERWWPWLEDFHLEGPGLAAGSVLTGVVSPPLPYRMRIRVELTRCEPPTEITALIHGDLEGRGRLGIRGSGATHSRVDIAWTVEMMQTPMRLADRVAHPLLQWGHDRVVEITVARFRQRIDAAH
ncbi:MAG TPA: SRPBCC family protein [Acidimicrobiales bacterium]|jgi:carbon monoxide dehydrogenase subunit G|nr:SRPBCC family protein [Acidimicrobiales bacterium]